MFAASLDSFKEILDTLGSSLQQRMAKNAGFLFSIQKYKSSFYLFQDLFNHSNFKVVASLAFNNDDPDTSLITYLLHNNFYSVNCERYSPFIKFRYV